MLPHQFIRVSVRRIWRKIKQPQLAADAATNALVFLATCAGPRSTIRKMLFLDPIMSRLRNSMKTAALTPPFSFVMNRICPRDVTAEIRLMR
jgi:hypothetical protein